MLLNKFFIKFKYLLLIINILLINNINLAKPIKASPETNTISTDYLKNIPSNLFYIIGPGDTFEIEVSEDLPELNSQFTVDGEGTVSIQRLDRIYISGLTVKELIDLLNIEFKKFVFEPDVKIIIKNYRPVKFFVMGEVEDPGLHVLPGSGSPQATIENFQSENDSKNFSKNNIFFPSVIDALRKSGGITMYADLKKIEITRKNNLTNGGGRIKTTINLLDSLDFNDLSQNIRVLDGDTIKISKNKIPAVGQVSMAMQTNINPKFINVLVSGRVESPGSVKINKSGSLNEALMLSGGTKFLKGKINFIRYRNDGEIEFRKFAYSKNAKRGSYRNPYLKNGDYIMVGKSFLNNTNDVLTEITSPLQGIISTYGFYKLITD